MQAAEAAAELAREEMNRYQQLGNRGAIAILQIKEEEQAFKAAVARLIISKKETVLTFILRKARLLTGTTISRWTKI
ncbi:MAG: hypothetical protein V7K88_18750 [Nostoc sp.]|uniref:hypothetical protein n=1 Tax=Nostoc sp. TaxID=1180 RepID=UPI002FF4CEF3